uniref:Retrotransposon gag domain-containing protein n=1 Tax=Solanum tuberosum TaxID=4113 RepID=M1CRZ2_SOLTU
MVDLSQAPVMGRFHGDNPLDWVMQTEKYFIFYDILSEHKLSWASFYLDGEALEWYRWLFRNKQLAGWDHFVDKLFIRFQSRKAPHNRFAFLRQFTTVDDSQARAATISSWSTIATSPSPQSWTARSDYNKVNSAHQVFGEKLNKTTNIVVDVKNATMLVKSGSAEMLANQAKEEVFHSILDATTEEVDCPVPQHLNEPLVYINNQAHKVFDEFSVASKDVILESHKVLTINTETTEESDYFTDVGNEDKNEEELFTIGNKIQQLVPAFVGIPQLWVDSTFSSFGYFAMFNMLHKLGIVRCSEELSGMLSTCKYDQLTNRGITDHFSRLGPVSLVLTLHLFPPDQFGLAFPFDPGSRLLTMFLRVTRNSVFCLASDNLDHNKFIMSTLWYSFIWAGKGQAQCSPGLLLSKSRELGKAEKIQGSLEAFAARYLEQFPNILVNKDDVLLFAMFGVHVSMPTLLYLVFDPGPYLNDDVFPKILVNKDDVLDAISVVFGVVEMKDVWRTCIKRFPLVAKIAVAYSFVCNIFTKALYSLSPNNDYGWNVTLQPYSHSSPVTWRGEHICGLEWQHIGTAASEHFSSSLEFLLALNHASVSGTYMDEVVVGKSLFAL